METNPSPIRFIHNFIFYSNDYESTFSVITYSFHRFHFGGHNIPQVLQFVAIPNWLHGKAQLLAVNRSSLALTGHLSQTALGEVAVELGVDLPLLPLVQLPRKPPPIAAWRHSHCIGCQSWDARRKLCAASLAL